MTPEEFRKHPSMQLFKEIIIDTVRYNRKTFNHTDDIIELLSKEEDIKHRLYFAISDLYYRERKIYMDNYTRTWEVYYDK